MAKDLNIIYLAAGKGKIEIPGTSVTYQDKIIKRDLSGCMLEIDLSSYDVIIATPPCNYWSRAHGKNINREKSEISQATKHLLPDILDKLSKQTKPYIVENVINKNLMRDIINNFNGFYYEIGRHSYFTNIAFNGKYIKQTTDFSSGGTYIGKKGQRQGGENVKNVLEYWLKTFS